MDPLRPFADAIRVLYQTRTAGTRESQKVAATAIRPALPPNRRDQSPRSEATLRASLTARIARVDAKDPRKMREAFVEAVLLWELGERLAQDAGFGAMVAHIADQLASDPAVSDRLQQLVAGIS